MMRLSESDIDEELKKLSGWDVKDGKLHKEFQFDNFNQAFGFMTRAAMEIEKIVAEGDFNYIDAICYYCESNNIEVESVSKLISKPLKERLKWDATRLNFMKPTSRAKLPL